MEQFECVCGAYEHSILQARRGDVMRGARSLGYRGDVDGRVFALGAALVALAILQGRRRSGHLVKGDARRMVGGRGERRAAWVGGRGGVGTR